MAEPVLDEGECSISRVCSAFTRSAAFGVIANDWSTLARQLGIREDKIQKLRQDQMLDKKSIYDIFHDLLSEWKMAESKNATVSNLIKILDGIGWADISGLLVLDRLRDDFELQPAQNQPDSSG